MLPHERLNPCQTRGVQRILVTGGFWQIPLHSESSLLTTFITAFARYCFKRLPFGISIAPEIFQRKMNELLGDFDGVAVYMNDLVHGKSQDVRDGVNGRERRPNRWRKIGFY